MNPVYNLLNNFTKQFSEAINLGKDISFKANNIIICGMGGSALAGDFVKSLFYPNLKITILKDYTLPNYVDDTYLCICVSYSGNTEETINAYETAVKKTKNVLVICSGGKLSELSKKNGNKIILVPSGLQPRMAFVYQSMPIINVLINSKLLNYDLTEESKAVFVALNQDFEKNAEKIVNELKNSTPIIYASARNEAAAYKWKISFNENAKIPAFYNLYPEFNHNELNSYTEKKDYSIIMLYDNEDNARIKKRFSIVSEMLEAPEMDPDQMDLEMLINMMWWLQCIFFSNCY